MVQVVDSGSQTASRPFSLTFGLPQISITIASPLVAGVGATYSQTLTVVGGTPPYAWSIMSGTLPAGLTLSSGGVISGTATSPGSFTVTINVTDADHAQVAKTFDINIVSGLRIDTNSLPAGIVGKSYQQTLSASGGAAPYSWSLAGGNLPGGISLSSAGVLSGTPSTTGTFSLVVRVTDSSAPPQSTTQAFGVVFTNPISINQSTLNNGSVGVAYSITMLASGGTAPYSWSIASGQLPPGLTLSSGGILSGTPTNTGTFNFAVQVSDSIGTLFSQSFAISIQTGLTITTASPLANALVNSPYSQQMQASTSEALAWSVSSGNLPPGIKLDSSGLISGTPTTAGVFDFTVQVTSRGAQQQVATQPFRLVVAAALAITSVSTLPDATVNIVYATTLTATGGVAPYSWALTSGSLPDGLTLASSGGITGTPNRTGAFTFTVAASDSSNLKTSSTLTMSVVTASVGSLSLVNVPDTINPTQQLPIGMSLSSPQPNDLSGSLTITFISNSVVPTDDPAVQFSSGSRTVAFTIPQNTTAAVFPTTVFMLIGSVSGTVVLTADFQDGPKGMPVGSIAIAATPPRITNIVPVRTSDGLKIQIIGYSPERRVTTAEFDFDVKAANGTQRVQLTRNVESQFDDWYRNASSAPFGSSFVFEQLFLVQGDSSTIQSVAVTLTNGQGSAASTPVSIPSIP